MCVGVFVLGLCVFVLCWKEWFAFGHTDQKKEMQTPTLSFTMRSTRLVSMALTVETSGPSHLWGWRRHFWEIVNSHLLFVGPSQNRHLEHSRL